MSDSTSGHAQLEHIDAGLRAATYHQVRVFLRRQSPPYPRFLYKYHPFDLRPAVAHQSKERLRSILVDCTLRFSSPAEFNDPFDMGAIVVAEGTAYQRRMRLRQMLRNVDGSLPRHERRKRERDLAAMPLSDFESRIRGAHAEHVRNSGVCCFAGNPRSILMWSHYAQNHTGICLQFNIARDPTFFLRAISVRYVAELPVINWLHNRDERLKDSLFTKYIGWEYEGEHRILVPGGAGQFLHFAPAALSAVILGCSATPETLNAVREALALREDRALPQVTLYRARKHPKRFAVTLDRIR